MSVRVQARLPFLGLLGGHSVPLPLDAVLCSAAWASSEEPCWRTGPDRAWLTPCPGGQAVPPCSQPATPAAGPWHPRLLLPGKPCSQMHIWLSPSILSLPGPSRIPPFYRSPAPPHATSLPSDLGLQAGCGPIFLKAEMVVVAVSRSPICSGIGLLSVPCKNKEMDGRTPPAFGSSTLDST